jgi:hypothetical protein
MANENGDPLRNSNLRRNYIQRSLLGIYSVAIKATIFRRFRDCVSVIKTENKERQRKENLYVYFYPEAEGINIVVSYYNLKTQHIIINNMTRLYS